MRAWILRSATVHATVLVGFCTVLATPSMAQFTGLVRGTIVDEGGAPIADATISIELQEDPPRRFTTTSNDKGVYSHVGLPSGAYEITAEKTGLGRQSFEVRVRGSQTTEVNFQLIPGQSSGGSGDAMDDDSARAEALSAAFNGGVEAARANRHDEALLKFREALEILPTCHQCFYNIGVEYTRKSEYEEAEAAFQRAIDIQPDYVDAYSGLATVYNIQRRFEDAGRASAEAARYSAGVAGVLSGANPADATFAQAIILWNASKIPEAKTKFEEVLALDAGHAEAHYWLGMASVNEGDLTGAASMFERYIELSPDGQYVEQAAGILRQVKP